MSGVKVCWGMFAGRNECSDGLSVQVLGIQYVLNSKPSHAVGGQCM